MRRYCEAYPNNHHIITIFVIKIEWAVQGWETVRALYPSEESNTHNQPMEGRKRENSRRQKERAN